MSEGVGRSRRQVYYIGELFVLTPENNKGTEGGECGGPTINTPSWARHNPAPLNMKAPTLPTATPLTPPAHQRPLSGGGAAVRAV